MADLSHAKDGEVVLPGDIIDLGFLKPEKKAKVVLGPGLQMQAENVAVTKPGVFRLREPAVLWIECHDKRYVPARGDHVIGIVISKSVDLFRVDIGTSEPALLSYLSFEGATKKNRPDVKVGDLIYARIVEANKDMEPELVCIDSNGKSNGKGVLKDGGYVIRTSCSLARRMLNTECDVLNRLGKNLPYEIAVGMNGRIWINGRSTKETLAIANAIIGAEFLNKKQIKVMIQKLHNSLAGF